MTVDEAGDSMSERNPYIQQRQALYKRRFRWFMFGDRWCRVWKLRIPLHHWQLEHEFTAKDGWSHGLWKCDRCGDAMNTSARGGAL